jgi:hypothetical protein
MVAQGAGDLLHRFELAPHRPGTPLVEELAGPAGTYVLPELLEIFSQQVRPHRPQIVFQQLGYRWRTVKKVKRTATRYVGVSYERRPTAISAECEVRRLSPVGTDLQRSHRHRSRNDWKAFISLSST